MILILFLAGIILLLIEIYLTPGSTLFGLLGVGAIIWADFVAFKVLDEPWNWLFALFSLLITIAFTILLFRILSSKNFSVQSEINSKVNVLDENLFQIGELGKTITVLRPNGRAMFGDQIVEVYSTGDYIEDEQEIIIVKRTSDKIFVKPINTQES